MTLIAIALGGATGSVLRYLIGGFIQRAAHAGFPYGTLAVNTAGCLIVGTLMRLFLNMEPPSTVRGLLVVGFCGGFTTFSAFTSETLGLIAGGEAGKAAAYVALTVGLCMAATAAGFLAARVLLR